MVIRKVTIVLYSDYGYNSKTKEYILKEITNELSELLEKAKNTTLSDFRMESIQIS